MDNKRLKDWDCPSCTAFNFSSRQSCFKCGVSPGTLSLPSPVSLLAGLSDKSKPLPGRAGLSSKILPGDWICNQCELNNFAARVKCISCGASHAGALRPVDRVGDWACPNDNCRFHNFANRRECHRCGTRKPFKNTNSLLMKAGDWICQKVGCGAHNFAKRDACFQCGQLPASSSPEAKTNLSLIGLAAAAESSSALTMGTNADPEPQSPIKSIFMNYGQSFFSRQNPFASYGFNNQA